MPETPGVHVIVTSRSSTAQEMTRLEAVEVGEMEPSEATVLNGEDSGGWARGEKGYRLSSDLRRHLPEYHQRRKELLQRRPKQHVHRYAASVLTTWESSFEAITTQDPAAARLLSLLAFVNFEDIFIDLFSADRNDILAGEPEYMAGESEATVVTHQTWRSYLSSGGIWTLNDLESLFEILQSYSLLQ